MVFQVEVNTARPGKSPIWRPITQDDGKNYCWNDPQLAAREMLEEGRNDFQIVLVKQDNSRELFSTYKPD